MFVPFSWRYVTSALAPTFRLPSMAVFLSSWKTMVLGLAESCSTFCPAVEVCDCPTVRVKEFFSTEAIFPDTDCSGAAAWLFDKLRSAMSWVVGGEKAHTATTRVRPASMVKITRPAFLIFEPSSDFRPSRDCCAEGLPRHPRNVNNPISSTQY